MRTLENLRSGERARVKALHASGETLRRLADMGLTCGAEATVLRAAPFGGAVVLSLRGYRLALSRKEAAAVEIE